MLIRPEDSANYSCCVQPKKCIGDKCMAWTPHSQTRSVPMKSLSLPPPPNVVIKTGLGYCGLCVKP